MPIYPAVLFDLDGTLIDTAPDFADIVNQLRARYGRSPLTFAVIRQTVSNGARALVTLALEMPPEHHDFEARRQELLALYENNLAIKTCLFDGFEPVLSWLESHGIPWGIVTNKPRRYAEPLLAALQLDSRCATLVCPDDVSRSKPDPEPLFLALHRLGCTVENSIYVGDHRRDIEAGKNAGMMTIAAHYGYLGADESTADWLADYAIEEPRQLLPLLQQLLDIEA